MDLPIDNSQEHFHISESDFLNTTGPDDQGPLAAPLPRSHQLEHIPSMTAVNNATEALSTVVARAMMQSTSEFGSVWTVRSVRSTKHGKDGWPFDNREEDHATAAPSYSSLSSAEKASVALLYEKALPPIPPSEYLSSPGFGMYQIEVALPMKNPSSSR